MEDFSSADPRPEVMRLFDPMSASKFVVPLLILDSVALLGNGLVIGAYIQDTKVRISRNAYIVNLAVVDFLVAVFSVPVYTGVVLLGTYSPTLCVAWSSLEMVLRLESMFSILMITHDRYQMVKHPLEYHSQRGRWRTVTVHIVASWTCAILIKLPVIIPAFYMSNTSAHCFCSWRDIHQKSEKAILYDIIYTPISVLSESVLPILCILCWNVGVYRNIRGKSSRESNVHPLKKNDRNENEKKEGTLKEEIGEISKVKIANAKGPQIPRILPGQGTHNIAALVVQESPKLLNTLNIEDLYMQSWRHYPKHSFKIFQPPKISHEIAKSQRKQHSSRLATTGFQLISGHQGEKLIHEQRMKSINERAFSGKCTLEQNCNKNNDEKMCVANADVTVVDLETMGNKIHKKLPSTDHGHKDLGPSFENDPQIMTKHPQLPRSEHSHFGDMRNAGSGRSLAKTCLILTAITVEVVLLSSLHTALWLEGLVGGVSCNLTAALHWLGWTLSLINPFLYAFISTSFRQYCCHLVEQVKWPWLSEVSCRWQHCVVCGRGKVGPGIGPYE